MSSQPVHHHNGPLIPMPELTWPALRRAVATVAPGRLPEIFEDMQQAFVQAAQESSVGPIRMFHFKWGVIVAIERDPECAVRFHAAEKTFNTTADDGEQQAALMEIADIWQTAEREVKALVPG
ncbi:hypothetical protein [Streptomyces orinoci]|uniref:Uncharacterized protein n=1 Tax=Streptomyces orinoci TaxID=67339 RepID=A0ABV3K221_STRON|nr:hypothetical protein [Streptomyces orinoci]